MYFICLELAEYQKEQELIQQRLHRHEQFIRGPPPPGGPPVHILPPPPPHMMPGQPLLPPGPPRPPQPPQPLLAINDTPPRGAVPPNPLIGRPVHGPPSGNVPPFLLPSPGGQVRHVHVQLVILKGNLVNLISICQNKLIIHQKFSKISFPKYQI